MFRTCGFFLAVPCQYYLNGLCERPFCHFRHSKHDVEKARAESAPYTAGDDLDSSAKDGTGQQSASSGSGPQTSTSNSGSSKENGLNSEPSPQSAGSSHENSSGSFSIPLFTDNSSKYEVPVAEEPEQYLTSCEDDADKGLGSSPYSCVEAAGASKALPAYLPTPKTPSLPVPKPEKDNLGIPVYQPTPKRELKRRHKDQGKAKKSKSADLEYDPECNYSCQGFVGGSQEKRKIKSEVLDYKPSEKKARLSLVSGLARGRKRPSCESLMARSPPAQGQEMLEGAFSDQEEDWVQSTNKVLEETMEEGVSNEDDALESFENIGDDDISSDDDFIDVPSVADDESDFKQQKPSVKTMDKKSSGSRPGSAKTISREKAGKKVVVNKRSEAGLRETQVKKSKQISSKYSGHDKQSKSSSHNKLEKTDKLSPQKKTGQPSSSGSSKKSSSASASAKAHSTEKSHSSEKTPHISKQSSQQKTEHGTHDEHIKHKTKALKSNHTDRPSSNHKCISKYSSSEKIDISGKHSSSKKAVLSGSKTAGSSSVSHSSSAKRPNADGKSKDSGHRRSSLESITVKTVASKSSDRDDDNKSKHSSNGRPSFESKASKDHGDEYDREIQPNMERKSLTSVSMKHSDSATRSDLNKTLKKHSNSHSGNKTPSDKLVNSVATRHKLPSVKRSTSTDSTNSSSGSKRPGEQSHHHHSSLAAKIKTGSSSRDHSKDRSAHSEDKSAHGVHHSSKSGKEYRSSHSESQKTSSSGKHTSSVKVTNSSSHHKSKKHRDSKSDSSRSYSSKKLERMNSSLFGEDSDEEDAAENLTAFDDGNPVDTGSELSDNAGAVEEERIDYGYINASDLEEEDTFDECLRIFKEAPLPKKTSSQPEKKLTKDQKKDGPGSSGAVASVPGKKRIAHKAAEQISRPVVVRKEKPRHLQSPQEQMHNRIMLMQKRAVERAAARQAVQEQEVSSTSGSAVNARPQPGLNAGIKQRIAHVPKPAAASTPSATKTKTASSGGQKKATTATTASKTDKRQAHIPAVSNMKRPMIPASFGSKVPGNIRQRYLNLIIDECLKFCPSEEVAYKKGLEEESGVYDRASNKNIYLRVAVNSITRLRTEARESMPGSSAPKQRLQSGPSQSHEATLGGARATKVNFTQPRSSSFVKKPEVALTGPALYQKLMTYSLTEQQLEENGYPRSCPDAPGKAIMLGRSYQQTDTLLKDNERTCSRCGKRFIVNSDGSYVNQDECVYHWTRAYPRKKSGFIQHIYNCCNSDPSSRGCQVAGNHVHDRNKRDKLVGFMRTMPRSAPKDGNYGIYALDCEMVYTVGGLELARVTVVNTDGESVYESLVQPFSPVVDYNTRFSGLTVADLGGVDTTLTDVQAVLLNLFSEKTILIGHSLESDFFALKLIHSTVVDTSVVFPHRMGPPYKRALKNLMLDIFQKIIQGDEGGHDSKEDAVSCLQLIKFRIKEDTKRESRNARD